jgi:hypothetical protein
MAGMSGNKGFAASPTTIGGRAGYNDLVGILLEEPRWHSAGLRQRLADCLFREPISLFNEMNDLVSVSVTRCGLRR